MSLSPEQLEAIKAGKPIQLDAGQQERLQLRAVKLAPKMFRAYNDQGPNAWKTFDGRSVPTWDEITDQVREKWISAARCAVLSVRLDLGRLP